MSASVGDRIRMHANTTDVSDRTGTIVAVLGSDGGPPYRVRFDAGEETIVTPGPDATIEPAGAAERAGQVASQVGEKAGEAAGAARDTAQDAAGDAARTVADAAARVAERFER